MTANGGIWSGSGAAGTTVTATLPLPLLPGSTQTLSLALIVNSQGNEASDYINVAEINSARDDQGIDRTNDDTDSTPDNVADNDAGGANDSPADDAIDGDGTGAPQSTDPATDEDDSDPENVPVFDLALTKMTNVITPVRLGETVPFTIEITNQGNITAQNIVINDYIPTGFTRTNTNAGPNGTAWTGAGDAGTTTTTTIAEPLAPGATTTVTIDLTVNAQGTQASDYILSLIHI